jgi:RND family efflux transporter MFP subunit
VQPDNQIDRAPGLADGTSPIAPKHCADSELLEERGVSTNVAPGTGRKIRFSAGLVAIVLLIAFSAVHFLKASGASKLLDAARSAASQRPPVNVITVGNAAGTRPLSLPGATAAWNETTIYARVNGYVAKWHVDIGDHVQRGQTLASIDTPELEAELTAARAELTAAEAQVKVKEAETEFAKTTNERWRDSPKGVVSEQERESKKADYDSALATLNAARAQVALNQAGVERLMAMARFKQVTAPFDGTITERHIDIGNLVTAGSTSSTTSLYRMSQDDPIRVFVDVPQSAAGNLMKVGVPVQIKASNVPDRTFSGEITRTANAMNPQARTLRVEVDLPNPERALVPGMYVDVIFELPTQANAVQVPAAALVFRSSGPQVAVVDNAGRVTFRKVTIARDDGNLLELGSGVSPGDKVALNISSQIGEGDKVTVNEAGTSSSGTALRAR